MLTKYSTFLIYQKLKIDFLWHKVDFYPERLICKGPKIMPRFLLVRFAFEFICSLNDKVLSIVTPRSFSGLTVPSSKISFESFIVYLAGVLWHLICM